MTDDSRDRVLAHLATCPQCKAAAAEQRRLKSVIAASELPAISAGLLARLQGLPGMGAGDGHGRGGPWDPGGPGGPVTADGPQADDATAVPAPQLGEEPAGPFDGGLLGSGPLGSGRFSYLGPARDLLAPAGSRSRGFRIHEPAAAAAGSAHPVSSTSRGRRFAFAAAGAFSMAAIAIGGALPMEAAVDGGARPDDGPAVSPLSANSVSDTRGVTPRGVLGAEERITRAPAARTVNTATSVSLPEPGPVPLVTPAVAQPARSTVVLR
ncbi:hypothetical protein OG552_23875 [Streptomyces sp. NBC_01476]|nr:hypothetical protein [Streptomyces sp. NBC_01476]